LIEIKTITDTIHNIEDLFNSIPKVLKLFCEHFGITSVSFMAVRTSEDLFDSFNPDDPNSYKDKYFERIGLMTVGKNARYIDSFCHDDYYVSDLIQLTKNRPTLFKRTFKGLSYQIYNNASYIREMINKGLLVEHYVDKRRQAYLKNLGDEGFMQVYPTFSDFLRKVSLPLKVKTQEGIRLYGVLIADGIHHAPGKLQPLSDAYMKELEDFCDAFVQEWQQKLTIINDSFHTTLHKMIQILKTLEQYEKPAYTFKHSLNTQLILTEFVKWMNRNGHYPINEMDYFSMKYGMLLHDVGKIQIPLAIIKKSGKLTPKEFHEVKKHSVYGKIMLENTMIPEFSLKIIKNHHEKEDGSGYPDGLVSEQIPPIIKAATIVDIFEALTGHRPYKRSYNAEKGSSTLVGKSLDTIWQECKQKKLSEEYTTHFLDFIHYYAQYTKQDQSPVKETGLKNFVNFLQNLS
jgi:HD-GYP domain-containing protein (c-di-GMP phosphodiesterase class II)